MKLDIYEKIRPYIKTGDCLAFSGGGFSSDLIKHATLSEISHVGIAMYMEPLPGERRLFCAESTTLNNVPDYQGEYRRGMQITPLSQRLEGYIGKAWLVPLVHPLCGEKCENLVRFLVGCSSSRLPYDTAQAIASGIDPEKWPHGLQWLAKLLTPYLTNKEDLKKVFCSELVTKSLPNCRTS
jgi:hypothetical protein